MINGWDFNYLTTITINGRQAWHWFAHISPGNWCKIRICNQQCYPLVMTFTVCHGKIHPFLIGKPSNGHVSHNQRVSWYFSMGKMAHLPGSFRQGSPAARFGKGNPCSLTVPQLLQVHQTRGSGTRGQVLRVKFWG